MNFWMSLIVSLQLLHVLKRFTTTYFYNILPRCPEVVAQDR